MNNELFVDDSPMIEEGIDPSHQPAGDMFGNPVVQPGTAANNNTSNKSPFGNADDIFGGAAPMTAATHASPAADDFTFTPVPAPSQQKPASPVAADDEFFAASSAAAAPAVSSSPPAIASPVGSQRNLSASTNNLPVASPDQAFLERGKMKLEAQRKTVQERTLAFDANSKKKEQDIQKKATDYLQEVAKKRDIMIATVKADHIREQQQYEAKMNQFKKSGAVWNSVNLLLDVKKPNTYSKNTEHMRKLIGELQQA